MVLKGQLIYVYFNFSSAQLGQTNDFKHLGMPLPSQTLGIIRIEQEVICSVVSQWGSTIKSPWVCPVTSWYPSL